LGLAIGSQKRQRMQSQGQTTGSSARKAVLASTAVIAEHPRFVRSTK
jgi:hypothetical protein